MMYLIYICKNIYNAVFYIFNSISDIMVRLDVAISVAVCVI